MKIHITESQLKYIRRYEQLKDCVKSDYEFLLNQGVPSNEAKEITIDHSSLTYLEDEDTDIEFTDENVFDLRDFIEDNFEDLIS
jgi:hypothetical protein